MTSVVYALVKPCLLLLAGGLAAQHSTLLLRSDHASLLLVASICLLFWRRGRPAGLFFAGVAVFMMAAGDIIDQRLAPEYAGDSMLTRVRVTDFPKISGHSVSLRVEPLSDSRVPQRSQVSWFEPPVIPAIGEVWELELRLRMPRGTSNPGVFDYETWLFREKLHATGYVVGGKRNRLLWSGTASPLERFRSEFILNAQAAADSERTSAVLAAIGAGERHRVSRDQWQQFAISGTSHLMAISGLHIGLAAIAIFLIAFVLAGATCWRSNAYAIAVLCAVVGAFAYAIISGFGVPARRAVIMLSVAAATLIRRRQSSAPAAIGLAAMVVYIFDPVATMMPGFHLSFAAVVLLLWLSRRKDVGAGARFVKAPRQLYVLQVFLLFGLMPITASVFQRFSLASIPANLVAVPLFSFVTVPLTLSGLAVGPVHESTAIMLLGLAGRSIDALDAVIRRLVELPYADLTVAQIDGPAFIYIVLPLLWVLLPRGWPGRWIAVVGVCSLVLWKPPPPHADCFDAWVLDVGQGLSVAVQTSDEVVIFDTGIAWRSGGSVAVQSILPFLKARGIDRVDRLIISHADLDHSGGVGAILEGMDVGTVIAGEPLQSTSSQPCHAGQRWVSAGIRFEFLYPSKDRASAGNEASCVLRVSAGAHSLLLTGDIEARSESHLVQGNAQLGSDVIIVPHHGSMTSSTVPFINSVNADYAVVSAGYANRWGFPKPLVVDRWQAAGAEVLNTATDGAVRFRICAANGIVHVTRERQRRHRFWYAAT